MLDKQNIEAFLKANGVKPSATDEQIRSVLVSAKWNNSEVDTALIVLKENTKSHETHVDTLHKVFNTDDRLNAAEINALLGIQVALNGADVGLSVTEQRNKSERQRIVTSFILSVVIATLSIGYVVLQVRVKHPIADKIRAARNESTVGVVQGSSTRK